MCKTYGRIYMRIGIVLTPFRIRIRIGIILIYPRQTKTTLFSLRNKLGEGAHYEIQCF